MHDIVIGLLINKVEFGIAITAFDFEFDKKQKELFMLQNNIHREFYLFRSARNAKS